MKTFLLMACAVGTLYAGISPANAYDRRIRIVNASSYHITGIWGSHIDTGSWENQILSYTIDPGESSIVNFEDLTGYCRFDLKAETTGGFAYKYNFNICEESTWTIVD